MNQFQCNLCGKTFRTYAAEARHRHNAPLLCNKSSSFWKQRIAQQKAENK